MIKVLVVDDSSFMRVMIKNFLESEPDIKVCGIARTGTEAVEKAFSLKPDVITMDINMPDMSGIDAVEDIMKTCPTPIVMISSLTSDGAKETIEALEKGAVDYINKSQLDGPALVSKVRLAAQATVRFSGNHPESVRNVPATDKPFTIVGIGISTGGPKALSRFIPEISPKISASIVIAQHMPPTFTRSLAERLDTESAIAVKEAVHGEVLRPGCAYICPGGMHARIDSRGILSLYPKEAFPKYHYSPSADILLSSIGKTYGAGALCIIMTGMGSDGLEGAKAAKMQGSYIMAQSESSCTIYGMPRAIVSNSLHDEIVHLDHIGKRINQMCSGDR